MSDESIEYQLWSALSFHNSEEAHEQDVIPKSYRNS